jgi:hypothetical protein
MLAVCDAICDKDCEDKWNRVVRSCQRFGYAKRLNKIAKAVVPSTTFLLSVLIRFGIYYYYYYYYCKADSQVYKPNYESTEKDQLLILLILMARRLWKLD